MEHFLTIPWIIYGMETFTLHGHGSDMKFAFSLFFSSVQFSRSVVSDSSRPHESQRARPPCPSATPRVHSDSRPSSRWCHPAISSSVVPFSFWIPQSRPLPPVFHLATTSMIFPWNSGHIWRVLLLRPLTTLAAQTEKWICLSFGIKLYFRRPTELESGGLSFLRPFHIDDHWKHVCSFFLLNKDISFSWRKSSIFLRIFSIFYLLYLRRKTLITRHF